MRDMPLPEVLLGIVVLGIAISVFLMPTILAKRDKLAIFVLNMFGFTLITWIIALVMAIQSRREVRLQNVMVSLEQKRYAPRAHPPPPRSAVPVWLLTPLVTGALLGLIYVTARYFSEPAPATIHARSSQPASKRKVTKAAKRPTFLGEAPVLQEQTAPESPRGGGNR